MADKLAQRPERKPQFSSQAMGRSVVRLYTLLDLEKIGFDCLRDLASPGEFPFTRGAEANGFRSDHPLAMSEVGRTGFPASFVLVLGEAMGGAVAWNLWQILLLGSELPSTWWASPGLRPDHWLRVDSFMECSRRAVAHAEGPRIPELVHGDAGGASRLL